MLHRNHITNVSRSVTARAATTVAGATLALALLSGSAQAATSCDRYASPTGNDSAAGTAAAPVKTAQKLANIVGAGQVGCLKAGTYTGGLRFNRGGKAGSPLTIQSAPGERATVVGRVYIPKGSDDVTVNALNLDGYNTGSADQALPSPTINAARATFTNNDVTNRHSGICFMLGNESYGRADGTTITGNTIHNCGRLPATNHDHGIYVAIASNTRIEGNVIRDNADRGVQLYPVADHTVVTGNVISGNGQGVIFSGDGGKSSNDNTVERNIIVNSKIRNDIESYYPPGTPQGTGNVARYNCVSSSGVNTRAGGFSVTGNVTAKTTEIVATSGGVRVAKSSPCANVVPSLTIGAGAVDPTEGGSTPPAAGGGTTTPGDGGTTPPSDGGTSTPGDGSTPPSGGGTTTPGGGTTTPPADGGTTTPPTTGGGTTTPPTTGGGTTTPPTTGGGTTTPPTRTTTPPARRTVRRTSRRPSRNTRSAAAKRRAAAAKAKAKRHAIARRAAASRSAR